MTKVNEIRMTHAALDEREGGMIVIRGVIDDDSLKHLLIDDYQREALPLSSLASILSALEKGDRLPDIELGLRGEKFKTVQEDDGSETFILQNVCYIIDGQQRRNGALHHITKHPDGNRKVGLGAVVRFGTDRKTERELFRIFNQLRSKVSPNVLIKNMREDSTALASIYGLCHTDKTFSLYERVCWAQKMRRSDLLTAMTLCKTVTRLHSHRVPGKTVDLNTIVSALDRGAKEMGLTAVRENVKMFYDLVDYAWGVRAVTYSSAANHLRTNFLVTLAQLFSDHVDFWAGKDDTRLFVNADLKRKIAQFPVLDPSVANLTGAGGKSYEVLYHMLRDHINRGRKSNRLTLRDPGKAVFDNEDEEVA